MLPHGSSDEPRLVRALADSGISAEVKVWSDPAVDWSGFDAVVVRSIWDYVDRLTEFGAWLDVLESKRIRVFNPVSQLRWNLRKDYLRELETLGTAIVPSVWIDTGDPRSPSQILSTLKWPEIVVKPRIGAGGRNTFRLRTSEPSTLDREWPVILESGGALIQPFLPEVETEGEWSLLFFGGVFSHAVVKSVRAGEFRIQEAFGGRVRAVEPPPALVEFARRVVQNSGAISLRFPAGPPLYARVDLIVTPRGPLLGELEMLEPSFFLEQCPAGAARFARALSAKISSQ